MNSLHALKCLLSGAYPWTAHSAVFYISNQVDVDNSTWYLDLCSMNRVVLAEHTAQGCALSEMAQQLDLLRQEMLRWIS